MIVYIDSISGACPKVISRIWTATDTAVTGGGPMGTLTAGWSVESIPATGTVDFDPCTAGLQTTSTEMNPTVKLGIDPNVFSVYEAVEFVLKLWGSDGVVYGVDYAVITVRPGTIDD